MPPPTPENWPLLSKLFENAVWVMLGGGTTGYLFLQRAKRDRRANAVADAEAEAEMSVIGQLRNQLELERSHSAELGKTVDRLAAERNEAVRVAGKLQGEVVALSQQVEHLSEQVAELQRENEELRVLAQDSNESVKALKLAIDTLLTNLSVRPCATSPVCPKEAP